MSVIKSFSVGEGDMFTIDHNSDNYTIIDCCLSEENKIVIADELVNKSGEKGITRFISTHPDDDHICGLTYLHGRMKFVNFYCVKNEATKSDEDEDFQTYSSLRDSSHAFYVYKGCSRKWMNEKDETRDSSGINILWPDTDNEAYVDALAQAKDGKSPNNISPIIKYSLKDGAKVLWMGDLETDFLEAVKDEIVWPNIDILFAPHHGRKSGKVISEILEKLDPKLIVIGEAPSKHLDYYSGYNTITQNSAGDIVFDCVKGKVHVYVSSDTYSVDFLVNEKREDPVHGRYIGTLVL